MRIPETKEVANQKPHIGARAAIWRLAEFLFTGAAVLPATAALGGRIDVAVLFFLPLLLPACVLAILLEDES